ncbi:MAG: hypothetical protein AABM42_10045 [Actinomycetota bacterium]
MRLVTTGERVESRDSSEVLSETLVGLRRGAGISDLPSYLARALDVATSALEFYLDDEEEG